MTFRSAWNICALAALGLLAGLCAVDTLAAGASAPYAGTFSGEGMRIELVAQGNAYTGTIHFNGQDFPVKAEEAGGRLEGSFEHQGASFPFTAMLQGRSLTFTTEGTSYRLKRETANPLAQAAPSPLVSSAPAGPPPASGEANASQVPAGYQAHQEGSGAVLIGPHRDSISARDLLAGSLDDLTRYFDQRPAASGGLIDKEDREGQASFTARLQGRLVEGLAVASTSDGGGSVIVAYDVPERLAASLPRLLAVAGKSLPQQGRKPVQMHSATLPDGSGTLQLPEGWQIKSATKGMVDVQGPDGAAAAFGIWFPVNTPESVPAELRDQLIVVPYAEPVQALQTLAPQISRAIVQAGGEPVQLTRIVEQQPAQFPDGQAAFVLFDADVIRQGQPVPYRSFALIITAPTGPTSWMYYFSQVSAPQSIFARELPAMLEMWKSYKVSDKLLRERLDKAAADMREIRNIIQSIQDNRRRAMEDAQANWTEVFRGTRYERDTLTGEMKLQPLHQIEDIVKEKNRLEGYQRYEQVPLKDLNRQ